MQNTYDEDLTCALKIIKKEDKQIFPQVPNEPSFRDVRTLQQQTWTLQNCIFSWIFVTMQIFALLLMFSVTGF